MTVNKIKFIYSTAAINSVPALSDERQAFQRKALQDKAASLLAVINAEAYCSLSAYKARQ